MCPPLPQCWLFQCSTCLISIAKKLAISSSSSSFVYQVDRIYTKLNITEKACILYLENEHRLILTLSGVKAAVCGPFAHHNNNFIPQLYLTGYFFNIFQTFL